MLDDVIMFKSILIFNRSIIQQNVRLKTILLKLFYDEE